MIGYVPQKILLDPDMPLRARDLVGLGLDGQRLGLPLPSARRRNQVEEMLPPWARTGSATPGWACCPAASSSGY